MRSLRHFERRREADAAVGNSSLEHESLTRDLALTSCGFTSAMITLLLLQNLTAGSWHWQMADASSSADTLDVSSVAYLVPNSTSRTPGIIYGHVVQHHQRTSSQQFYNLLYNKFTTNGQKFATSQHLDMSIRWALALRCGKFLSVLGGEFVVQQVVELLWACPLVVSYQHVRSRSLPVSV